MHKVWLVVGFTAVACLAFSLTSVWVYAYWATSVVKIILFLGIPAVYFFAYPKQSMKPMFRANGKKPLLVSAAVGLGVLVFIIVGFILLRNFFDMDGIIAKLATNNITKATYPFVFIYIVFINAFMEEVLFRGFAFQTVYNYGYKKVAYVVSALLFSVYHLPVLVTAVGPVMCVVAVVGLFVAGLFFNEVTRRCKNIWGSLVIHMAANLAINSIGAFYFFM